MTTYHRMQRLLLAGWLLLALPVVAHAQTTTPTPTPTAAVTLTATTTPVVEAEDCPALVQEALDLTQTRCEAIDNNEVCYGHSNLEAASRPGFNDFDFSKPGDIEDVIAIGSLSLGAMDTLREEWGVLLLSVQAQVAALTQGELTFVIFGNSDLAAQNVIIPALAAQNINLRETPTNTGKLVTVIPQGERLTVSGRTADDAWLYARIVNAEQVAQAGWLSAALVTTDQDLTTLSIADPDAPNALSPSRLGAMQAFYFESGVEDAPCAAAPDSGMLIQTPEGQASVTLFIDEVIIELDATAFVKAQSNGELTISVLEGDGVKVTANGETRTALPGTEITIPLDADLGANGVPNDPEPYDLEDLNALPTDLLPETVEIAEPLTITEGVPAAGSWVWTWGVSEATCPDGTVYGFENSGVPSALTLADGGATVLYGGGSFNQQGTGIYTRAYVDQNSNLYQDTLTVEALDVITGVSVIDLAAVPCTLTVDFTLRLTLG
ncbi:MAG: SH3 domain-containing protein [Armatimonadetes bacterium]|nr:SH3 domain-containing protein [Anaerolineae bacterium]